MAKAKAVLGYAAAGMAVPLLLAALLGMEGWMQRIAASGVRISPWITGDSVALTVPHDGYQTRIHKPVFMGLLWETDDGFVQVDWTPKAGAPAVIDEQIDYDGDGTADFRIWWDTQAGEIALTPLSADVLYLEGKYELDESWSVRVRIKNTRK
jgi:hypothetical protein